MFLLKGIEMEISDFATLVGMMVAVMTIAGSALAFVIKYYSEAKLRKRDQFFQLMELVDGFGPIAQKLTAICQLRFYPEHKDFIVRFCAEQQNNIAGDGSLFLSTEMQRTVDFYR